MDSSRLTTSVSPAGTPGELTVAVVVVRADEAVAETTLRTKAPAEGTCGVADASLDCGETPTALTAATL